MYCACETLISGKTPRLKQHLQKCSKFEKNDNSSKNQRRLIWINQKENALTPLCSYILKQPSMSNYVIKTTAIQREEMDKAMVKFLYACNIPFRVSEHKYFIQVLWPGYDPPNRKQFGDLLNKIQDEAQTELKGKTVTLMQDGWSDIHNTPVIANVVYC